TADEIVGTPTSAGTFEFDVTVSNGVFPDDTETYTIVIVEQFPDVASNYQFADEIYWLAQTGIAGGYNDGTFRPTADVSRQAVAAFLYRLAGEPAFTPPVTATFPDVPTSHQF